MPEEMAQPPEENQVTSSSLESEPTAKTPSPATPPATKSEVDVTQGAFKPRRFFSSLNAYSLLVAFIILLGAGIVIFAYKQSNKSSDSSSLSSQGLTADSLKNLTDSDVSVGNSDQILKVDANAIFSGNILVRQNLDIAGGLHLGNGTLAVSGFTAADKTQLSETQIDKNLTVAGNTSLQGGVSVSRNLQVGGTGSFGGTISAPQVNTARLQITGDFSLTSHLALGGASVGRSNGGALGGGGTSSVSGSDSGGSITINTGSSPAAGCFINVSFARRYNTTPRVLLTPVGSAASAINYYVNRSSTGFSVCTSSAAPASASFGFDYFVFN